MSVSTVEATAVTAGTIGATTTLGELLAAVKAAAVAVDEKQAARSGRPELANVEVAVTGDTVTVTGASDTAAAQATATAGVTVARGCVLLPTKPLLDLLTAAGKRATKRVSDTWGVAIAAHDGAAVLEIGGMEYRLPVDDSEYFNVVPDAAAGAVAVVTLPTPELLRVLDFATVAVSRDTTVPILGALRLELSNGQLSVLSTDRYRLASVDVDVDSTDESDAQLEGKQWKKIKRHLDKKLPTTLYFHASRLVIVNGGRTFTNERVEGDYPKVRSLFPDYSPNQYVFDADTFHAAVASVAPAAERNTPIRLTYDGNNTLTLDAGSEDRRATATVKYSTPRGAGGDSMVVGFNPHYLLECLKSFSGQQVTVNHTIAAKPALFESGDGAARHIVMPVRLGTPQ